MAVRSSFLCVALSALGSACSGEQSLTLTVDPATVAADGMTVVELRADIVFRGDPLPDGKRVTFRVGAPLLFASREDAAAGQAGWTRPEGDSELGTSTRGGAARAYLLVPAAAGPLHLEASYTTVNRDVLSDSRVLDVGPPPLVAAARLLSEAGCDREPAHYAQTFVFTCVRKNVGAFVDPRAEIRVTCTLDLRDAAGNALPHTPVQLFAEAGELRDVPATRSKARAITYAVPYPLIDFPHDVPPHPEEESRGFLDNGSGLIPSAEQQNPRDGLVTLLAVVRGHEAYFDKNGNGRYDEDEPFCDEGEPFLDVDDDNGYDARVDVACCDSNGNGRVDGPNSRWDGDALIGRVAHILWSGPVDPSRSFVTPDAVAIPAQGGDSFEVWVMDRNFNPVAAVASGDDVRSSVSPATRIGFAPGTVTTHTLENTHGMVLDDTLPFFLFGRAGNTVFKGFDADAAKYGRSWPVSLEDKRTAGSSALCQRYDWTLTATVQHTPADGYSGASFDQLTSVVTGTGTLEPLPGPCP